MQLPENPRYPWSPIVDRPVYDWPGGKRLAVYIALNVEHFAFGRGLGHIPTLQAGPFDIRTYAWRDYGLRVGIWRLFDMLDALGLPACHLINTAVTARCPEIIARILARGDGIVAHGRTNSERASDLLEADEELVIAETTEDLAAAFGRRPLGWMGPWIAEGPHTSDLLAEAGYHYNMHWPCDDQPIWLNTRAGPLLNLPYPIEINDSPAMLNRMHTAADFTQMIVDQISELLDESAHRPLVAGISLHTFVVGQPFRTRQLREALTRIKALPGAERIWWCVPDQIAAHVRALPAGTVPGG